MKPCRIRHPRSPVSPDDVDSLNGEPLDIFGGDLEDISDWYRCCHLYIFGGSSWHRLENLSEPFGLHVSIPFIKKPVLNAAARLPRSLLGDNTGLKPVLKYLVNRELGVNVANWSKMGFPAPDQAWLNGPLRQYVGECAAGDSRIRKYLNIPSQIDNLLKNHSSLAGTLLAVEEFLKTTGI